MRDPFWPWLIGILVFAVIAFIGLRISEWRYARRWAEEDRRARHRLEDETVVLFRPGPVSPGCHVLSRCGAGAVFKREG